MFTRLASVTHGRLVSARLIVRNHHRLKDSSTLADVAEVAPQDRC